MSPVNPSSEGGRRQQRAAELRAEAERSSQGSTAQASPSTPAEGQGSVEAIQSCPPVGQGAYVVKPGDCISSIAKRTGHFWETIWNDAGNAELQESRHDPNVLLPGDCVSIPEKEPKQEPGATEQRHCFRRKGEPSKLHLQVLKNDQPLGNQPFVLQVDDEVHEGVTDAEGKLEARISGAARRAVLTVGAPDQDPTRYILMLGDVAPVESLRGVQQRLFNLGFACPVDGVDSERTRVAIRWFQRKYELAESGEVDAPTRDTLREKHGC